MTEDNLLVLVLIFYLTTGPPFCSWVHTILKASWLARSVLSLPPPLMAALAMTMHTTTSGFPRVLGVQTQICRLAQDLDPLHHPSIPPPFLPLSLPPRTLTVSSLFLKVGAFSACFTQKRLPQAESTLIFCFIVSKASMSMLRSISDSCTFLAYGLLNSPSLKCT